jgi:hypothetical protein
MKHTPLTDASTVDINSTLYMLQCLEDKEVLYVEGGSKIIEVFETHISDFTKISIDNIKEEFWELANEFQDPVRLKNIYKVKFKNLLNWNTNQRFDSTLIKNQTTDILIPFLNQHTSKDISITNEEALKIASLFLVIVCFVDTFKTDIESLLEQCEAFAGIIGDTQKYNSLEIPCSSLRLATKRKTDFIKLLSAMYDTKMFVDADGKPVTNKQKLMEAFGEFLGDDFSAYSTSLSQAKTRDEKTFVKPFKEIEKEALRYFNSVGE